MRTVHVYSVHIWCPRMRGRTCVCKPDVGADIREESLVIFGERAECNMGINMQRSMQQVTCDNTTRNPSEACNLILNDAFRPHCLYLTSKAGAALFLWAPLLNALVNAPGSALVAVALVIEVAMDSAMDDGVLGEGISATACFESG